MYIDILNILIAIYLITKTNKIHFLNDKVLIFLFLFSFYVVLNGLLNGKTRLGFLAQELQSAMSNNENEILDLVYDVNPDRLEAKYGNLIPVLVKAVQELSAQNQALTDRITALENA